MSLALGVTEIYANEKGKLMVKQGKVMKFDRTNTIDIPLVSNERLASKGKTQEQEDTIR